MGADEAEVKPGAARAAAEENGQVFHVHYGQSVLDNFSLKITAKPKALGRPFKKAILEPFFKAWSTKNPEAEAVQPEYLEKVLAGPGNRLSDRVTDLSVSVRSLIADDVKEYVRVDLMPRKDRDVKLELMNMQLDATLPAKFVHIPLRESLVPNFLKQINEAYETTLTIDDVAAVQSEVHLNNNFETDSVDIMCPACEVLPRAGRTKLEIKLKPDVADAVADKLPKPPSKDVDKPIERIFRVRCGAVELKLTLTEKLLAKSLRDAVVSPFLRAMAKKTGAPCASAEEVIRVEVGGMAVSDALRASSLEPGADMVRVDIFLQEANEEAKAEVEAGAKAEVKEQRPASAERRTEDEVMPSPMASHGTAATGEATGQPAADSHTAIGSKDYYRRWDKFEDTEG